MNALDNRGTDIFLVTTWRNLVIEFPFLKHFFLFVAARNHVNRMCLAADIPLIESGTAGYLGQVTVIKKVCFLCFCVDSVY